MCSLGYDDIVPWEAMQCAICSGITRPLFSKDGYDIHGCEGCGHRMADVPDWADRFDEIYGDAYFKGGGQGYSDYLNEGWLLRAAGKRYGRIAARYAEPGRLLDVGAAAGFLLQGFGDAGWHGIGIEPNDSMAEYARSSLGLEVITGTIENIDACEEFDLVSMIQVIGHFKEPRIAVEVASRALRPGGCLLIESWDRSSLTARLFGRRWHEYSPPSVLHWFSRRGLCRLVEERGFRQAGRGRPLKLLDGGHAKSLLEYKLSGGWLGRAAVKALSAVPDRLPIVYPGNDLFWAIFRK